MFLIHVDIVHEEGKITSNSLFEYDPTYLQGEKSKIRTEPDGDTPTVYSLCGRRFFQNVFQQLLENILEQYIVMKISLQKWSTMLFQIKKIKYEKKWKVFPTISCIKIVS